MPSGIALWGCPPAHRRTMSSQLIVHRWPKTCSHRPFPCSCRRGAACLGSTTYPRWESDGGSLGTPFRTTFRVHFWYPFGVHFGSSFGAKNGSQNPPQRGYVGVLNVPQSDSPGSGRISRHAYVGFPTGCSWIPQHASVGFSTWPSWIFNTTPSYPRRNFRQTPDVPSDIPSAYPR